MLAGMKVGAVSPAHSSSAPQGDTPEPSAAGTVSGVGASPGLPVGHHSLFTELASWNGDAYLAFDLSGDLVAWSGMASRVLGWSEEEALARGAVIVPEEYRGVLLRLAEDVTHSERPRQAVLSLLAADGNKIPVAALMFPLADEDGHVCAAGVLVRPVAEWTRRQGASAIEEALAIGMLGPIVAIEGYAALLKHADVDSDPARRRKVVAMLAERTAELSRIVEQLIAVTRLEAGDVRVERDEVDLSSLLRAISEDINGTLGSPRVRVADTTATVAQGDGMLLRLAVSALTGSVLKNCDGDSEVTLCVMDAGDEVSVVVSGERMKVEALRGERFFDRPLLDPERGPEVDFGPYLASLVATAHSGRTSITLADDGMAHIALHLPA
ncbi:MAG: hypothetical protein Kow0056_12490 [Coriobacteriia bacterium]